MKRWNQWFGKFKNDKQNYDTVTTWKKHKKVEIDVHRPTKQSHLLFHYNQ